MAEGSGSRPTRPWRRAFEKVDYVIAATNPGPAFAAEASNLEPERRPSSTSSWLGRAGLKALSARVMGGVRVASGVFPRLSNGLHRDGRRQVPDLVTMGGLTIISNIYGNPAVSIPAGTVDGLPVGMQVLARHHRDAELFDVALAFEREIGWPKVAPAITASAAAHASGMWQTASTLLPSGSRTKAP